jgi:hypothetical protein
MFRFKRIHYPALVHVDFAALASVTSSLECFFIHAGGAIE